MDYDSSQLSFLGKGLVVGVLTGVVVSAFRFGIVHLLALVKAGFAASHSQWWWLLVLLAGFGVVWVVASYLLHSEPDIGGSGIPQIEGLLQGSLYLEWWQILWKKWLAGLLSIGSGLFLGREGPSIMLGAMVGAGVAQARNNRGTGQRLLVASGAAAGLSAAFNAPIAATLFVLEEIYHNFSPLLWITALTAAIAANMISAALFGLNPVLQLPTSLTFPMHYYWALLVLGIIVGLLGRLYQLLTVNANTFYRKLHLPFALQTLVPLLLLLPLGWFAPEYLGGGHDVIITVGARHEVILALTGLFLLRLVGATLSYGSGLPGGIFLPMLSLGAVLGAVVGQSMVALGWLPQKFVVDCLIYAMAGFFACVCKAPFTAILLITEMVGSLHHLMPLAIVALVAYIVVDVLHGAPIYAALLDNMLRKRGQLTLSVDYVDHIELAVMVDSIIQDRDRKSVV